MPQDLDEAKQCGREFAQAGMPFSKLSEALSFCDSNAECVAFIQGVLEGPPLTEEEERAWEDYVSIWSPSEWGEMLTDALSPSDKRAYLADYERAREEADG